MVERKKELCILHIGMPKTGSSTIQENLFQKVEDERVSYTDLGVANQSGPLYGLFLSPEKVKNYHYFKAHNINDIENFRTNVREKLEKSFLDFSTTINILSAEDLYHCNENEIQNMQKFLEFYFKKILIIAYVRPVYSFYSSAFQQRVFDQELGSMAHTLIYHKYRKLKYYDDIYGRENVKIVPFLPNKFVNNDLLSDFTYHCGLKQQTSKIKILNESLSKETVSVLYVFNKYKNEKTDFGINNISIRNRMVSIVKKIGNEKFQFSGNLIHSIVENQYKDDYDWLLSRIPADYKEDFLFDPNMDGINTENELMQYAVEQIDSLVELIQKKENINFPLEKHPQTVAKLVNIIRNEIAREMGL